MPRELSELQIGESWAYRQKKNDPVTCVEVQRVGTSKPARVLVRFVGNEYEGRQEWVPPSRLKVRWAGVDEWRRRDNQWTALREASEFIRGTTVDLALNIVEDQLRDCVPAEFLYNSDSGIMRILDVDALIADLELDRDEVTGDPVSFLDTDGALVVPWRVTQKIVHRLTRKHADALMQKVETDEREAQQHNLWGCRSGRSWISAEICAEVDEEFSPARELVRQWCGAEAKDRYDELVALRAEVTRLGGLIERSIAALRRAGSGEADLIERELGIPLEALQQAKSQHKDPR